MTLHSIEHQLSLPADLILQEASTGATIGYAEADDSFKSKELGSFTYYPNDNKLIYEFSELDSK